MVEPRFRRGSARGVPAGFGGQLTEIADPIRERMISRLQKMA
jgi:hypothetical protein